MKTMTILASLAALVIILAAEPATATHLSARHHSGHGDIVSFGHGVTVPAGEEVRGDVVVFGGSAEIHGKVDGDAVVMGGTLHIYPEGSVAGDTIAFGGGVVNESRTRHPAAAATPSAEETPSSEETTPPEETPAPVVQGTGGTILDLGPSVSSMWASVIIPDLIITFIVFALFPLRTRLTLDQLVQKPVLSGLLGFLSPAILVIVVIALAITVVGIPLIPVAVIGFIAAYFIGKAALALFIGQRFMEVAKVQQPKPFTALLIGLLVLLIITGPTPLWFAIVALACIGCIAVGAALVSFLHARPALQGGPPTVYAPAAPGGFAPPPPGTSGPPAVQ